jgi:hypothetical protein
MNDLQARLDYADAVAEWFLDMGEDQLARADWEGALRYTRIAAIVLARQNRTLSSARVEAILQRVAGHIAGADQPCPGSGKSGETCLHVLTEALPTGGLIAISRRWILNDRSSRRHSIVLLDQRTPVPEGLAQLARERGGDLYVADPDASLLSRAVWLRQLARKEASCVVLNVDVADVIWGAAFGSAGGPPVMLVNQNAHLYWTGGSLIDLLLNIRGSALEGVWASTFRAIPRYANVPIPLPETAAPGITAEMAQARRAEARRLLDLPSDAIILLTVGSWFKFLPLDHLDFVATCERLLGDVPQAIVLAVGFPGDERWRSASLRRGSRIRTLGRVSQAELATLRAASDIYLEGFPFGTTSSLLEASLDGLPVVLAPATCPPPYGTDGLALDDVLVRPATVDDYVNTVIRLARHPADRQREGTLVRQSVYEHHSGDGWRRHLEVALGMLPGEHAVRTPVAPVRTPVAIHEYWSRFVPQWSWGFEQTLEYAVQNAYASHLKPQLSPKMLDACRRAGSLRAGQTIPLPLLILLCNHLLAWFPARLSGRIFRLAAAGCGGSLRSRLFRRIGRWLRFVEEPREPYQEYRSGRSSYST